MDGWIVENFEILCKPQILSSLSTGKANISLMTWLSFLFFTWCAYVCSALLVKDITYVDGSGGVYDDGVWWW